MYVGFNSCSLWGLQHGLSSCGALGLVAPACGIVPGQDRICTTGRFYSTAPLKEASMKFYV